MQHLAAHEDCGPTIAEFTTDVGGLSTDFDSYYLHSIPHLDLHAGHQCDTAVEGAQAMNDTI